MTGNPVKKSSVEQNLGATFNFKKNIDHRNWLELILTELLRGKKKKHILMPSFDKICQQRSKGHSQKCANTNDVHGC